MTTVTVKFVNEKEGSKWWSIKTPDDKWYSFDHTKLSLAKGKTYDVETTSTDKDGRTYYTITAAREQASSNGAAGGGDRWWINAVSNWVAHSIAAGFCTEPGMLKQWAAAAKTALEEVDAPVKRRPAGDADDTPF
jgi:hypothetical protein